MDVCLCMSSTFSHRSSFQAHKQPHRTRCFWGGSPVLNKQRMSSVVPVSSSSSLLRCQADLRWQTCGLLLSFPGRGVLSQMISRHGYQACWYTIGSSRDCRVSLGLWIQKRKILRYSGFEKGPLWLSGSIDEDFNLCTTKLYCIPCLIKQQPIHLGEHECTLEWALIRVIQTGRLKTKVKSKFVEYTCIP